MPIDIKSWLKQTSSAKCSGNKRQRSPNTSRKFETITSTQRGETRNSGFHGPPYPRNLGSDENLTEDLQNWTNITGQREIVISSSAQAEEETSSAYGTSRSFAKRQRHKTRPKIYEPFSGERHKRNKNEDGGASLKHKRDRTIERKKRPVRLRHDLARGFQAKNIGKSRLTLHQPRKVGLFNRGKASVPQTASGLPDLVFSEMRFLSNQDEKRLEESRSHIGILKERDSRGQNWVRDEDISTFYSFNVSETKKRDGKLLCRAGHSTDRPASAINSENHLDRRSSTESNRISSDGDLPHTTFCTERRQSSAGEVSLSCPESDRRVSRSVIEKSQLPEVTLRSLAKVEVGQLGKSSLSEVNVRYKPNQEDSLRETRQPSHETAKSTSRNLTGDKPQVPLTTEKLLSTEPGVELQQQIVGGIASNSKRKWNQELSTSSAVSELLLMCRNAVESIQSQFEIREMDCTSIGGERPLQTNTTAEVIGKRRWQNEAAEGVTGETVARLDTAGQTVPQVRDEEERREFEALYNCSEAPYASFGAESYHWGLLRSTSMYSKRCSTRPNSASEEVPARGHDELCNSSCECNRYNLNRGLEGQVWRDNGHRHYQEADEDVEETAPAGFWRPNKLY